MSTFMDASVERDNILLIRDTGSPVDPDETGSGSGSDSDYDYDIDESYLSFDWAELGPSLSVYTITFLLGIIGNILILVTILHEINNFNCSMQYL